MTPAGPSRSQPPESPRAAHVCPRTAFVGVFFLTRASVKAGKAVLCFAVQQVRKAKNALPVGVYKAAFPPPPSPLRSCQSLYKAHGAAQWLPRWDVMDGCPPGGWSAGRWARNGGRAHSAPSQCRPENTSRLGPPPGASAYETAARLKRKRSKTGKSNGANANAAHFETSGRWRRL